jgi:serine/threonine protein kinase
MQDEISLLFREVSDLDPAERARYFREHEVPPELRTEVESLLRFDSSDAPLVDLIAVTAEEILESGEAAKEGLRCGPYRLTRLLGRGGAGEVFLAERVDGQIEQRVAIKLLRQNAPLGGQNAPLGGQNAPLGGQGAPLRGSFQSRFLQERQILASLQHPGIAHLIDAGATSDGRLYLALDYIDGVPIDEYSQKLDLRGKLQLFLKVCDAVSYAHRNLIIHRDLKPSNILVGADGEPKLLDFGIAKILDAANDQTRTQDRLLTPEYASPEQVRGMAQSTATDVYSLGAVFYRMLTGQSPHVFSSRSAEAVGAAICSTEPVRASSINPELPQDLDYVLARALRKEPEERYSSVEAMGDDVRAFLEWRPIRARSGNVWYRTRKFIRRYRVVVGAATLTIAGLSAGLYIANRQRIIAQERFDQVHLLSTKVFDLDAKLRMLPGSTEARHELVSMSLDYLERLGSSAHGDLDLAQEIGAAYMRVARIQGVPTASNLGDAVKADASLVKASQFIDMVLASRKANRDALILSAGVAQDRMILADSQGHKAEAAEHAREAVERLDQLFRLENLTQAQRSDAAVYYANIAVSQINQHLYEQARQYARKSAESAESLPSEARMRAASLSLIGSSLRSEGRLEEALQNLREARDVVEQASFPVPAERALDLYGILLREARTLGQDSGVSLGRTGEAIAVYQQAVNLMEEQASKDPRDQNARDRLATCSRELAELLEKSNPKGSLEMFDLGLRRLREVKNNLRARRREAQMLAESSYALRSLGRISEARRRIDDAFALLRETKDYPASRVNPDSEVAAVMRARADFESQAGDRKAAVAIYERLFAAIQASKLDTAADLEDAAHISNLYISMAEAYTRAGEAAKAAELDQRRLELWRQWDLKLPHNGFVQRQLTPRP